jgi:hypothetical protein
MMKRLVEKWVTFLLFFGAFAWISGAAVRVIKNPLEN